MKHAGSSEYTLLLITSCFPFGSREPFIDSEIDILAKGFRRIVIISQDTKSRQRIILPDSIKIYRYNTSTSIKSIPGTLRIILRNLKKFITLWQNEVRTVKSKNRGLTIGNRIALLKRITKAYQLHDFISNILNLEGLHKKIIIYSYWLNTGAHATALFDTPGLVKIARAHGSDLYEEKSPSGFLPLLQHCSMNLDSIFFVSDDGLRYFSSKYPEANASLMVSRLGIRTGQLQLSEKDKKERFVIVSCSNVIPLKRIDLIIKSLALVRSDRKILWVHYGDGYLRDETKELASITLDKKNNIEYEFRGQVPNDQILKFYNETRIGLFINTSLTEGLPVSIMEAQLHGIPAIATDVGGVREVVTAETGKLVSAGITPAGLASVIEEFIGMPPEEHERMSESCKKHCLRNFDADTNYSDFILKVNSILASHQEAETY